MGAPNISPAILDEFNVRWSIDAQLRQRDVLDNNADLLPLFWTVEATTSIADETSDKTRHVWPEFDSIFFPFKGTPLYSTMRTRFAEVAMTAFSKSLEFSTEERRRALNQNLIPAAIAKIGDGAGERERIELLKVMNAADVLECYDGQNLADIAHPGKLFDLAADALVDTVHINFSTTFALSVANLEIVRSRMVAYRDSQGTHLGNRWMPRVNQPQSTGDRDRIAIIQSQFHIYVAKNLENTAELIQRILETDGTSVFNERFTYSVHDELPDGTWAVFWLNNIEPTASRGAPFLHKRAGVDIFSSLGFESLNAQRHRRHEINAHAEFGFDALHWHRFYLARE